MNQKRQIRSINNSVEKNPQVKDGVLSESDRQNRYALGQLKNKQINR